MVCPAVGWAVVVQEMVRLVGEQLLEVGLIGQNPTGIGMRSVLSPTITAGGSPGAGYLYCAPHFELRKS